MEKNPQRVTSRIMSSTALPAGKVRGAEEVCQPVHQDVDHDGGGWRRCSAEVEVGQAQLGGSVPGQETPDVSHHHNTIETAEQAAERNGTARMSCLRECLRVKLSRMSTMLTCMW